MFLDIHSHILPGVDDGAADTEESLKILEMMKSQGITDVIATPHFYANSDNLEGFLSRVSNAFSELKSSVANKGLPNIILGTEVLYYPNIGKSESVYNFCISGTDYLLLELTDNCIGNGLFADITALRSNMGIIPIIAHLERYYKSSSYKKLLRFLSKENISAQLNASSLFSDTYSKAAKKLIKGGYIKYIATDSHSFDERPPMLDKALQYITEHFGSEYSDKFIRNSEILYRKIAEANNGE